MINGNFMDSILPERGRDFKILTLGIVASIISCLVSIWSPSLTLMIIISILAIILMAIIRIHILQILLLSIIAPVVSLGEFEQLSNILVAAEVLIAIFWIVFLIASGYGRFDHLRSLDLLIAIYLFFAFNTVISSLFNSSSIGFAGSEIIRNLLYAGLIGITYHFMRNINVVQKLTWAALAISIAITTYGYKILSEVEATTFYAYGLTVMHGITGGLSNANAVATTMANAMPFLIAYIMFGNRKGIRRLSILILLYNSLIWILWNSRGNYLFVFAAFMTLIMFHRHRRKFIAVVIICLLIESL